MTTREPLLPSIDEPEEVEPPMIPIEPERGPPPSGIPLDPKYDRPVVEGGRSDPAPACDAPQNSDQRVSFSD